MKACTQDIGEMAFVTSGHYHGQANNDSAHNSPAYRIESSQDNGWESEESYIPKCRINSNGIDSEKDAAKRCNSGRNTLGQCIHSTNVDAHS